MATNEMRSDSAPPAPSAPGLTHHGAPPDHRRPQPRALAEALQGARGSAMRDSQSVSSDPPSEEDYDENVRPAFTSGPDHPGGIQRRSHLQQGTRSPNIRRNDSGIHIFPEDEKAVQDLLKRSSQRVKDPKAVHRNSRFSNLVFTAQFSAFDRNNEAAASSPFHGFYTLFWLAVALFVVKMSADNWREYGHPLGTNDIMKTMFRRDVVVLLLSDGLMCSLTGISWLLQKVVLHSYISWDRSGWVIQNIWQTVFIACVITWPHIRDWPWTHTVFFVMHGIVMLMKQHSYAFYNGYLSTVYKTRKRLLSKLKDLEHVDPVSPGSSEIPPIETSYLDAPPSAMQRRKSLSKVPQDEETSIDKIARAIASGDTLNDEQIQLFERVIKWEIDALADELKGTASDQSGAYPRNLTFMDHYKYIPLPTVVYEISYPRSETINWSNVAEKTVAMFGIIFVMIQVSQRYIYPIVMKTVEMKESGMPFVDRFKEFPWLLSDLIFPFMMEYLLSWYLIWETILNILAELTYFADRSFYDAWWNSGKNTTSNCLGHGAIFGITREIGARMGFLTEFAVSWDQFARDWNRPVHTFLLRHVYHSSISSMKVNKHTATLITFFLSACIHEVIMWCIFKKLRGYLLVLQMCQLPLVRLSRTKWLKGRKTLGNLIFWLGIFTGPSVLCSLYLIL